MPRYHLPLLFGAPQRLWQTSNRKRRLKASTNGRRIENPAMNSLWLVRWPKLGKRGKLAKYQSVQ
jgi:hypothetical protein